MTEPTSRIVALRRRRWFNLVWLIPLTRTGLAVIVFAAGDLRDLPSVEQFFRFYPGHSALLINFVVDFVVAWIVGRPLVIRTLAGFGGRVSR